MGTQELQLDDSDLTSMAEDPVPTPKPVKKKQRREAVDPVEYSDIPEDKESPESPINSQDIVRGPARHDK